MSATSGLRKRRTHFFVQVPRDTIRDRDLSFRARGLLGYLLDMPEGWDVKSEALAQEGKEGREAIRTTLHELGALGYYRIERRRLRSGRFEMGTAISEERVPEWAEEYAEFEGKPVPCKQQPDGTFLVQRKDGSLRPDGFARPDERVEREPSVGADPDEESPAATGDGFPGSGSPASGEPASGGLGAIREREKGDARREKTTSDASLRSAPAAADEEGVLPGMTPPPAVVAESEAGPAERTPAQVAATIVREWQVWVEAKQGAPIPTKTKARAYHALVGEYVLPALECGATERQVRDALKATGEHWAPKRRFDDEVVRARGGTPLSDSAQRRPRQGSNLVQVSAQEREQIADSWTEMTASAPAHA